MAQRKRAQNGRYTFQLSEAELETLTIALGVAGYGPSKNGSAKKWEKFFREAKGDRVLQLIEVKVIDE